LLNASSDSVFTIDRNYHLISYNKTFSSSLEALGMKVEKGFDLMQIFPDHDKSRQRSIYDRALAGESFELIDHSEFNGIDSYYAVNYAPLKNENGQVIAAAAYAKDVTEKVKAQQQSDKLLKEAQATAEELRAQEEEMRQNMEELQSIQEELSRKSQEIEEIRKLEKARADEQIEAQKAVMMKAIEKFRQTENLLNEKVTALEKELAAIKSTQKTTA
jgi:PAS domain S-box-containing protein